jgi:quinol monooxygenase YgiN
MSFGIPDHIVASETPVACVGTFSAKPGKEEELARHIWAVVAPVREEDGCLQYTFHAADERTIVLYELWESGKHLIAHGSQPHMREYFGAIAGLVEETSVEVQWMQPLDEA